MKYIQHQNIKKLLIIMQKICFYHIYKDEPTFKNVLFSFENCDLLFTNVIEICHDNTVKYISLLKEPERRVKKKLIDKKEATITIYYKNKRNCNPKHFKKDTIDPNFTKLYKNFIRYVFDNKNILNELNELNELKKLQVLQDSQKLQELQKLQDLIDDGEKILGNKSYSQTIESIQDLLNNKDEKKRETANKNLDYSQEKYFSSLSSQLQKTLSTLSLNNEKTAPNIVFLWLLYYGLYINIENLKKNFSKCYKYYSCDTSKFSVTKRLINRIKGSLFFAHPKLFNDPFDVNCFLDPQKGTIDNNSSYRDLFRIFCSTDNYDNLLMWAHYGDSHKGVCIEYNTDSIITDIETAMDNHGYDLIIVGNVIYSKRRKKLPPVKNLFSISNIKNLVEAAFWKDKHWEYENEFRFVIADFNSFKNLPRKYGKQISGITVKGDIDNIFLGVNNTKKSLFRRYHNNQKIHQLKLSKNKYEVIP